MFNTRFDLFFGRNIGDHGFVHREPLDTFLADHVSTRFPGFTLTEVEGSWEGAREQTLVVSILGTDTDRSTVGTIALAYKTKFAQDAVLIVETAVTGELV